MANPREIHLRLVDARRELEAVQRIELKARAKVAAYEDMLAEAIEEDRARFGEALRG